MEKKRPDFKYKPHKRELRALAGLVMRLPCNRKNADKLCVYESQRVYAAYFREVRK